MGRLRASLAGALLLLALAAGCGVSGADSAPVGGALPVGGVPGGGSGGGGGNPGDPGHAEWQEPAEIDDRFDPASAARVVVDPTSGDAVAVWLQFDGSGVRLWASRLDRSAGRWSTPEAIDDEGEGDSSAPQLAADGLGDVLAVWVRDSDDIPSVPTVWVARHTPSSGWGSPVPLDAGAGPGRSPQVAANASGVAVVAWIQQDGTDDSVWTSRFDPSSDDWSVPAPAETFPATPGEDASSPSVALTDTGDTFVAWLQPAEEGSALQSVWANRFDAGTLDWDGPLQVDNQTFAASSPQVGADADGNAVVLWEQDDHVLAARFVDGTPSTWSGPQQLDTSGLDATRAALAVGRATGHAVAVWRQTDSGVDRIWASRLDPVSGDWSDPARVQTSTTAPSDAPHVALDPSGNAIAVWQQDVGGDTLRIRSSRLATTESEWSGDERVKDNAPGEDATAPRVAVDADGDAVAVWLEAATGVVSLWGNVRE